MVKKLNRDAFLIKILLDKGLSQGDIVKILNLSFQKVNYWAKTDLKTTRKRRRKIPEEYFPAGAQADRKAVRLPRRRHPRTDDVQRLPHGERAGDGSRGSGGRGIHRKGPLYPGRDEEGRNLYRRAVQERPVRGFP